MYLNHTSGCISQRWFQIARSFLTKGCNAVNAANLQFIPAFGRSPELAGVWESLAVLSQLVYPIETEDYDSAREGVST